MYAMYAIVCSHRHEGVPGEPVGGLGLDGPEAKAAGQEDGAADKVGGHALAPRGHLHPDHPYVEHLVGDDLLVDPLVGGGGPQRVVDRLDRTVPGRQI